MIIFYGRGDDTPLARAVETAGELGVEHVLVDQRQAGDTDLWVEVGGDGVQGRLVLAGAVVDLAAVQGIYARPLEVPAAGGDPLDARRASAFASGFLEWLDLAPGCVVNPPAAMHSNASKPYQAQLVARAGFLVPATLVTDDPQEVLAFRREHTRVVYKSISGVRSIVRELDDSAVRRLDRSARCRPSSRRTCPGPTSASTSSASACSPPRWRARRWTTGTRAVTGCRPAWPPTTSPTTSPSGACRPPTRWAFHSAASTCGDVRTGSTYASR